jgi:hypothetical protein
MGVKGVNGVYMMIMDFMVFRPIITKAIMLFMAIEAALRRTRRSAMTLEASGHWSLSIGREEARTMWF